MKRLCAESVRFASGLPRFEHPSSPPGHSAVYRLRRYIASARACGKYRLNTNVARGEIGDFVAYYSCTERLVEYLSRDTDQALRAFLGGDMRALSHADQSAGLLDRLIRKRILVLVGNDDSADYAKWLNGFSGRTTPDIGVLYLFMTFSCNFACKYCVIMGNKGEKDFHAKTEDLFYAVDLLLRNADGKRPVRVYFYGGEPLLRLDAALDTIAYLESRIAEFGMDRELLEIVFNTNGSLIDENVAGRLSRVRNIRLAISIDGIARVNDEMRVHVDGSGTFADIDRGLRIAKAHGIPFYISLTVGSHNVDSLLGDVDFMAVRYAPKGIEFNILKPLESGENRAGAIDDDRLMAKVFEASDLLLGKYRIFEGYTMGRRWQRFLGDRRESLNLKNCGGQGDQIVLSPSGRVGPCHAFAGSERYFMDKPASTENLGASAMWQEWSRTSPPAMDFCRNRKCPFIDLCGGDCPYESLLENGALNEPRASFCGRMEKLMLNYFRQKLVVYGTLCAEAASG